MRVETCLHLICLRCVVVLLVVLSLWVARAGIFGSSVAGFSCFLEEESAFVPLRVIDSESGKTLEGRWLSSAATSLVRVMRDSDNNASPDDWTLSVESGTNRITQCFVACYGRFRVYGVDVDGDGQDEIVIEHGLGRGTSCHVQYLSVLKVKNGRFKALLEPKCGVAGYLGEDMWRDDDEVPLNGYMLGSISSWVSGYYWVDVDGDGRLEISVRVIDPENMAPVDYYDELVDRGYWGDETPPSYAVWRAEEIRGFREEAPPRQVYALDVKTGRYKLMRDGVAKLDSLNASSRKFDAEEFERVDQAFSAKSEFVESNRIDTMTAEPLDHGASVFVPAVALKAPGTLSGCWLARGVTNLLHVIQRQDDSRLFSLVLDVAEGDGYGMIFQADRGRFCVYGLDVDGDGQDEVVLEHGCNDDERFLSVYRIADKRFKPLFSDCGGLALCGTIYSDILLGEWLRWRKTYFWTHADGGNRLGLSLALADYTGWHVTDELFAKTRCLHKLGDGEYERWRGAISAELTDKIPRRQVYILDMQRDCYEPVSKGCEKCGRSITGK